METQKFVLLQFILIFNVFVYKTVASANEKNSRCYNPNNHVGMCISIYECQPIIDIVKTQNSIAFAFVRKSQCPANGEGRPPFVCCTSDTGFEQHDGRIIFPEDTAYDEDDRKTSTAATKITTKSSSTQTPIVTPSSVKAPIANDNPLIPKPPVCGPIVIGNKIYGGEEVNFGEFPWLAHFEYEKGKRASDSICAGNIISQKYILTAAHCVKGEIEIKYGKIEFVIVGVHDLEKDCNDERCLNPFQRLQVERIIAHTDFGNRKGIRNHNDIALVRTDRNMEFSILVAPICLPDVLSEKPELVNGTKLSVAGWGHTGNTRYSPVKLKVELPYVQNENCPTKVSAEQLCAGGEFKKDSCGGDSGGGLVRLVHSSYILEGIVSYGRGCGLELPAIYTRVSSYTSWIRANVQP